MRWARSIMGLSQHWIAKSRTEPCEDAIHHWIGGGMAILLNTKEASHGQAISSRPRRVWGWNDQPEDVSSIQCARRRRGLPGGAGAVHRRQRRSWSRIA